MLFDSTEFLKNKKIIQIICSYAIAQDFNQLMRFINQEKIFIDVKSGLFSSVAHLARKQEHAAVDFLLLHFKASPVDSVFGYATVGNVERIEEIKKKNIHLKPGMDDAQQFGYALVKNETALKKDTSLSILYGYILGGHDMSAEYYQRKQLLILMMGEENCEIELSTIYGLKKKSFNSTFERLNYIGGLARRGCSLRTIKKQINLKNITEMEEDELVIIVQNYGAGGHIERVWSFLKAVYLTRELEDTHKHALLIYALRGLVTLTPNLNAINQLVRITKQVMPDSGEEAEGTICEKLWFKNELSRQDQYRIIHLIESPSLKRKLAIKFNIQNTETEYLTFFVLPPLNNQSFFALPNSIVWHVMTFLISQRDKEKNDNFMLFFVRHFELSLKTEEPTPAKSRLCARLSFWYKLNSSINTNFNENSLINNDCLIYK